MSSRDQIAIRAFGIGAIAVGYGLYVASAAIGSIIGLPGWAVLIIILILLIAYGIRILSKAVGKEDRNKW